MIKALGTLGCVVLLTAPGLAADPPGDLRSRLVGGYHFELPECNSGAGFGLHADGTASYTEYFSGTWHVDGAVLVMDLVEYDWREVDGTFQEVEIGREVIRGDVLDLGSDTATFHWHGTGTVSQVYRCP